MKFLTGFMRCGFWLKCKYYDKTRLSCIGNLDAPLCYTCSHYHYKKAKIEE